MDSRASFTSQESTATHKKMNTRRRPLHTCAASILVITQRASTMAQGLNGPLGFIVSMLARFATLAGPIVYAIQYQWIVMAFLKFVDDRILAVEAMIERAYPPSSIVFNKIDDLVGVTASLPGKLDEAVDKMPTYSHHVTFLDWVLVYAISMLKFVITRLTNWRISRDSREKEIVVDNTSCYDHNNYNEPSAAEYHPKDRPKEYPKEHPKKPSTKVPGGGGTKSSTNIAPNIKGPTYKEVLTKDTKQGTAEKKEEKKKKREEINKKKAEKNNKKKEEVESAADDGNDEHNDGYSTQDPILDLFDSAWLMKPRKKAKENYPPRSVSFIF